MVKKLIASRFALLLYLVAAVLRLIPVIAASDLSIGLDDMFQYDMLARSLAAGEGFRWYGEEDLALVERYFPLEWVIDDYDPRGILTSFRAPGYPFFLSIIYRLSGLENRFFIARLVQALLMAFMAPMTYWLGQRLFPDRPTVGKGAGMVVATYPYLVIMPLALATEILFLPLVLGTTLVLLRASDSQQPKDYLLTGLLFGATMLTRSVILAALPLVGLWIWFQVRDRAGAVLVLVCVLAITVPWSVRNTRLHGEFTLIENSMGYNLYLGYHPETEGRFEFGPSIDLLPYLDDAEREAIGKQKALAFIQDAPERVPYLMLRKLGYFFGLERRVLTFFYTNDLIGFIPQPYFTLLFLLFTLPFSLLCLLSAISLSFLKLTPAKTLVGLIFIGYLAPHVLILADARLHLAMIPFLAVFGVNGWLARKAVLAALTSPGQRWKFVLAVVLAVLLLFNWGFELWRDAETLRQVFGPYGNKLRLNY